MKFLLAAVNAKYIHSNPAIYSLRCFAGRELQEHIELAEYTINNRPEQILSDIYQRKPDVVGFSCYIWNWAIIQRLVTELSKIMPGVPIWLGGPEVSFEYEQVLKDCPQITGIMVGEGEETFRELAESYRRLEERIREETKNHSSKEELAAAVRQAFRAADFSVSGTATHNGFYGLRPSMDINLIPFYYGQLSEEEEKQNENRIVYYESGRGCPFRCSYCLSSLEKSIRLRNPEIVKRELKYFLDKKVFQVKFVDRTFNCNREHAMEIWRFLKENDNNVTNFHFEIAADLLEEEELELLSGMRPGQVQLEIGVQTTNRETLEAIHRASNLEKLRNAVLTIHSFRNIHQHLDLIAGLPYEDEKSFENSFNQVYGMKPDQLQLGFLKVLKGSEMYERAEEYGIVYQSEPPYEVLYTKWLSYEDVCRLKRIEEMVELFYNSNQFTHTLPVLEKLFVKPYDMFLSLAEFYEKNGYFVNSPARVYRYQVLLQFIEERVLREDLKEEQAAAVRALFRELLTFDMYLRENMKSRPEFAADLSPYRKETEEFYRREEENPSVLKAYFEEGYDRKQIMRMTHVEAFHYPVWNGQWAESLQIGKTDLKETYPVKTGLVLFDYKKRNPLTGDAEYIYLNEE